MGMHFQLNPEEYYFNFTIKEIILLSISGFIGVSLADTLLLKSLNHIGAGRNAVLSCLFSPFVILISVLFLGESFSYPQMVGFLFVVTSTVLVSYQKSESIDKKRLRSGTIFGILAVAFIAIGMTMTKPIVNNASPIETAAIRMIAGMLGNVYWILITNRSKHTIKVLKSPLPWKAIVASSLMGSYLALVLWIIGFKYTEASTASVLNQTSVLFTLVFAAIFLKERIGITKLISAVCGFVGVAFLMVFS